jgi:hypothetical protein
VNDEFVGVWKGGGGDFKVLSMNFREWADVRNEKYRTRRLRVTKLSAAAEPLNNDVQLQ